MKHHIGLIYLLQSYFVTKIYWYNYANFFWC